LDEASGRFTVVAWDHNLAFGAMIGRPGARGPGGRQGAGGLTTEDGLPDLPSPDDRGRAGDLEPPDGMSPPEDGFPDGMTPPEGGGFPGSNILVERFLGNAEFAALYDDALADLRDTLFDSGLAQEVLTEWSTLLTTEATALVDPGTVAEEAEAIRDVIEADEAG
jgi:spore coat protein CotH